MLPFSLELQPGISPYRQVILAVKRAVVTGQLAPGDAFPSVRELSRKLKINHNTAHKAVSALVQEGLLQVEPGVGTTVAAPPRLSVAQRQAHFLEHCSRSLDKMVVEACRYGLSWDELIQILQRRWLGTGPARPAALSLEEP